MTKSNIVFLAVGITLGVVATWVCLNFQSKAGTTVKKEFGIRMTKEGGVSIFGVDEIQARLKDGAVITDLQCKGANFQKTGEDGENVTMYFSGGAFEIELTGETSSKSYPTLITEGSE